jgi:E3 ubiquitin-protein ligase UHRF1
MDLGDCFTYTGEGGRALKGTKGNPKNLRTAPQSKDQTLTKGNLALSLNIETRISVRVIRGYKANTEFTPEYGYRYDGKKHVTIIFKHKNNEFIAIKHQFAGLYTVEKYWLCVGKSGFKVFKFALRRCPNQAPPPWEKDERRRRKTTPSPINGKRRKRKKNQTKVKMVKRSRKVSRPTKKIVIKASTPLHQLLLRNE